MPRNDAADRYSPEIALALATGPTVRDATRKSDVLRAMRTPYEPIRADASPTSPIAVSAMRAGVVTARLSLGRGRRSSAPRALQFGCATSRARTGRGTRARRAGATAGGSRAPRYARSRGTSRTAAEA